jgi:hypothetical protein
VDSGSRHRDTSVAIQESGVEPQGHNPNLRRPRPCFRSPQSRSALAGRGWGKPDRILDALGFEALIARSQRTKTFKQEMPYRSRPIAGGQRAASAKHRLMTERALPSWLPGRHGSHTLQNASYFPTRRFAAPVAYCDRRADAEIRTVFSAACARIRLTCAVVVRRSGRTTVAH